MCLCCTYIYRPDSRCTGLAPDSPLTYTDEEKLLQNIYKSIQVSSNFLDTMINITYSTYNTTSSTNARRILSVKTKSKDSSENSHTRDVEETILKLLSDVNKDELKNKVRCAYMLVQELCVLFI